MSSTATPAAEGSIPAPARFRWEAAEVGRKTLFPIRNEAIWKLYKTLEGLHWVAQEVSMANDKKDWLTRLNDAERHFIKYNLGLFARFDNIVVDNLKESFQKRFKCMELQAFFAAQEAQEHVHIEAYMLQAEGVLEGKELEAVFNSIESMPAVRRMAEWAAKYSDPKLPDGDVLIAWAAVEGVIFQGPFASLQWLRERGLLPGITEYNGFICRDEGHHTLLTCHIALHELLDRPTTARVHEIMGEVLPLAANFVAEAMPKPLLHISPALLNQYVEFQADAVLDLMGYPALSGVTNPFPFMDKLALNEVAKANFFEKNNLAYQGAVAGSAEYAINTKPIEY